MTKEIYLGAVYTLVSLGCRALEVEQLCQAEVV